MKTQAKNHQAGFTLIEYIMALVVAAMVYSYMGSALIQSSEPIFRLQKVSNLSAVMENIVADHNRLNALNLRYKWQASIPYRVGSIVTPKNNIPDFPNGGHYYKKTNTGTQNSGSGSGPAWPTTTVGATVTDGTAPNQITWTEVGTILDRSNTSLTDSIIKDSIKYYLDNAPGRYDPNNTGYTVVAAQTKFIKFSSTGGEEDATGTDEKNILKVTIKNNDSAETLSELFTIR